MKPLEEMNEEERAALRTLGKMAIHVDDFEFADHVIAHQHIGFGRMMQIISYIWRAALEKEYPGIENGASVPALLSDLNEDRQRAYLGCYESDPLAPYSDYWKNTD